MPQPEPAVIRTLRAFKARLLLEEHAQMAEMARRWLQIEQTIQAHIDLLADEVTALRAAGQTVSRGQILRLARYRELLAAARRETERYLYWADDLIAAGQERWVQLGLFDAQATLQAAYQEAGLFGQFGVLHREAVEVAIGYASDGTPLRRLLQKSFPDAVEGLTRALIENVALGKNPRELARAMRDGYGVGLQRSLVLARDQQMRAYRSANDAAYAASGVVRGKQRVAAHDGRTCLACLARDGEVLKPGEPGYDHAQGRCSFAPLVVGLPDYDWQTGAQWFAELAPDQQRAMMGPKLFAAWQAGKFRFDRLATETEHRDWGRGLAVTPTAKLTGE